MPDSGESSSGSVTEAGPTPLGEPISIAVGGSHACAVLSGGRVYCWGENDYGQLGVPGSSSTAPVQVPTIEDAVEVSTGQAHTCVVRASGTLSCFGRNEDGQLGAPLAATGPWTSTPTDVAGLPGPVLHAAGGAAHTCVVLRDLQPYCFGRGSEAAWTAAGLTADPGAAAPTPRRAAAEGVFSEVVTHSFHTCFLSSPARHLYCMGVGGAGGRLGPVTSYRSPLVRIGSFEGLASVGVGPDTTCVVESRGKVQCVGDSARGMIGTPKEGYVTSFREVAGLNNDVIALASASVRMCALTEGGKIDCFGPDATPTRVPFLDHVTKISAYSSRFCTLGKAPNEPAKVHCWQGSSAADLITLPTD